MTADPHPNTGSSASTAAEVAAQLAILTQRLDDTEQYFAATLAGVGDQLVALHAQVDQLGQPDKSRNVEPTPWTTRATPADWRQLAEWVDWLQASYEFHSDYRIPPCWPAHIGVAEELAGLYHSWRNAQIADEHTAKPGAENKPGSNDLTGWHDRWLWPLLHRLRSTNYRIINCKDHHERSLRAIPPTNCIFSNTAKSADDQPKYGGTPYVQPA